jgi:translation initiation factor 1
MSNSRLVYSTEQSRYCTVCNKPAAGCVCRKRKSASPGPIASDGVIRIQREVKGRNGKTVTTLSGFSADQNEIKKLAAQLKSRCGTGGSVKDGVIVIQGDHRETLLAVLKKSGYQAKLAGG